MAAQIAGLFGCRPALSLDSSRSPVEQNACSQILHQPPQRGRTRHVETLRRGTHSWLIALARKASSTTSILLTTRHTILVILVVARPPIAAGAFFCSLSFFSSSLTAEAHQIKHDMNQSLLRTPTILPRINSNRASLQ